MTINWKVLRPAITSAGYQRNQYLMVLDEEGNILKVNAKMQRELKLKNLQQMKANFFDLLHPVHIEDFRNALQYSVKTNNPYPMEFFLKNGRYHSMKWQLSYLTRGHNELKMFLCMGMLSAAGTTDRRKISQDKNTRENIFGAYMKNTPDLIWAVDEKTRLVYANDRFLQYFQLDETAINQKIIELLPPAVADALYENHLKVLQTGLPVEIMQKGKSADGTFAVFRINLFLADGTAGKKLIGGIARDLSARKMAERKLEDAHQRLVNISRITSDAIWEWDLKTDEIFRNEKLVEMTGYLPEDHKNLVWWLDRVHPDDKNQLIDKLKEVTDNNLQSWESEYRFLCADGEYKNMHDHGFVLYEKGVPVKMIGSLSDISGEKLLENLLVEEKLRQFKNVSEAAIRVQEQERTRLGRELHDNVNQILSTIKMFVGMLTPINNEEKNIKEKVVEYAVLAIEEIRKLSRELVSPQLDGGTLATHINKMLTDIELSTQLKIKFTYDSETELLSPGKKLTLFRIVQEQVKNILKYSQATHVEVFLQSKDDSVQLIINDNGIGFDMKKTNSGIGLDSIRNRAKFYNGKTEIKSAPGQGCQVMVSIPLLS